MEETEIGEVGTDKVGEGVHEKAREEAHQKPWLRGLALSTAVFAVLAAIASLRSGQFANDSLLRMNEATLKQAQASDQWAYYQAEGIKGVTHEAESNILASAHAPDDLVQKERDQIAHYKARQDELGREARALEQEQQNLQKESSEDLERHHRFAYAVTILQVAIGLSAIAALLEQRRVWWLALLAGAVGAVMFAIGFLRG